MVQEITGKIPFTFDPQKAEKTFYGALLHAAKTYGSGHQILEDTSGNPKTACMRYKDLLIFTAILGQKFKNITEKGERVGILMPNVNVTLAAFFALSKIGRVPTMLPFIVEPNAAQACCEIAKVSKVITARSFLKKAMEQGDSRPQSIVEQLEKNGTQLLYLEDLGKNISFFDKLRGLGAAYHDLVLGHKPVTKPMDVGVILFTSGSEGQPKGVALAHKNVLANHLQCLEGMELRPKIDVLFNALPNFHCFGLLASIFLPLFNGVKIFMHTNPKDAALIPGYIEKCGATLTFTTNSFLESYAAEVLKPDSKYTKDVFRSLRYIWAGAEALKEETRLQWLNMFDVEVMQGYGVTETSPVVAVNYPQACKHGSIGRLVAATEYALKPIEGIKDGYELCLKGPHVMLGYILPESEGEIMPLKDGWHHTGDVVRMDEDGYIYILGRLSRFIKVKGEKVPLSVTENTAKALWPEAMHGAGKCLQAGGKEVIILFTTYKTPSIEALEEAMKAKNIPLRHMPVAVQTVEELPLLGSGKLDLVALDALAKNCC